MDSNTSKAYLYFNDSVNWIEYGHETIKMMGAGCLFRDIINLGGIPCLPHPQMN